jgi:hypothetical protein
MINIAYPNKHSPKPKRNYMKDALVNIKIKKSPGIKMRSIT